MGRSVKALREPKAREARAVQRAEGHALTWWGQQGTDRQCPITQFVRILAIKSDGKSRKHFNRRVTRSDLHFKSTLDARLNGEARVALRSSRCHYTAYYAVQVSQGEGSGDGGSEQIGDILRRLT